MPKRILLDENIPVGLLALLRLHDVHTAPEMGWAGITNGRLLDEAERAGFEVMVTADQNIKAQQRLAGRTIALVVVTTNHWQTIREGAAGIADACDRAACGSYIIIPLLKPRRRWPPSLSPAPSRQRDT